MQKCAHTEGASAYLDSNVRFKSNLLAGGRDCLRECDGLLSNSFERVLNFPAEWRKIRQRKDVGFKQSNTHMLTLRIEICGGNIIPSNRRAIPVRAVKV